MTTDLPLILKNQVDIMQEKMPEADEDDVNRRHVLIVNVIVTH
jgi:hypothetical protein